MAIQAVNPVRFIGDQFKTGGFVGDLANAFKLANFWTESLYGATSELSGRITNAGSLFKNYLDAISIPAAVADIGRDWERLDGSVRRTSEFVSSNLTLLKNVFGGAELVNKVWGEEFVSGKDLKFYSPISGAATLAFAGNQVVFENIPGLVYAESAGRATSSLLKLVKHVALVGVGALALIAAFYCPVPAVIIPALLTIALVFSVVSRFFDGLILDNGPRNNPPRQEPEIINQPLAVVDYQPVVAAQQGDINFLRAEVTRLTDIVGEFANSSGAAIGTLANVLVEAGRRTVPQALLPAAPNNQDNG